MSEGLEKLVQGVVLEEFEFEGRPAQIVKLTGEDADTFADDFGELALNLARNQETVDTSNDNEVKGLVAKLHALPLIGKLLKKREGELESRVQSSGESRKLGFQNSIKDGKDKNGNEVEFVGIYLDGRIVSIVGLKKREKLSNGRQIYEPTSGATLFDKDKNGKSKYAEHGFSKRLLQALFQKKLIDDPDAVWMGDSKNPNVINSWVRNGWNVVGVDDSSEFAKIFRERNQGILDEVYRKGSYKIGYLDPKSKLL
jgi:hypothetical protein